MSLLQGKMVGCGGGCWGLGNSNGVGGEGREDSHAGVGIYKVWLVWVKRERRGHIRDIALGLV